MSHIPTLTDHVINNDLPKKDFIQSYKHLLQELWDGDSHKPFLPTSFKVKLLVDLCYINSNFLIFKQEMY